MSPEFYGSEIVTSCSSPEIIEGARLLALTDRSNPYVLDAMQYTLQADQYAGRDYYPEATAEKRLETLALLGEHAAIVGSPELADYAFSLSPQTVKWQLFAKAYEHAALPAETMAAWQLALESDVCLEEIAVDPKVKASMHSAKAKIALADYRQGSLEAQTEALADAEYHKRAFRELLDEDTESLQAANDLNLAFAKAGIWEQVEAGAIAHPTGASKFTNQMVVKAIAGQLTVKDRAALALLSTTGKVVRWINANASGQDPPPVDFKKGDAHYFPGRLWMEYTAPAAIYKLGIDATADPLPRLHIQLAGGDFEAASQRYAEIAERGSAVQCLEAALIMSRAYIDVCSAQAANKVYGDIHHDTIAGFKASIAATLERDGSLDVVAAKAELEVFAAEIDRLYEPSEQIRSLGRLCEAYCLIDSASPELKGHTEKLETLWTGLEQQIGTADLLGLRDQLWNNGICLTKRWKTLLGARGCYVGYAPTLVAHLEASNMHSGNNIMRNQRYDVRTVAPVTEMLNQTLGEERYIINTSGEQPVLDGSWATNVLYCRELKEALDYMSYNKNVHPDQTLSDYLQRLLED